jgi:S-adenosylmethionine-diacylgycerolhomoserine-N-methlytransferase
VIGADLRILLQLLRGRSRRGAHRDRLQAFYGPQARHYDAFRERLLHGRRELVAGLRLHAGARVVELGGGTGRNLLFFGERLAGFDRVELVDLCPALLERARTRTASMGNVRVVDSDAVAYRPEEPVDCVYFSYSLSMIPDWRGAIDNALAMLRPGGLLGVVDFYVSEATPPPGATRHGALTRLFWPRWFAHDGVRLNPRHLRRLQELLPDHVVRERSAPVPYLPAVRVPYYLLVGRKPGTGRLPELDLGSRITADA